MLLVTKKRFNRKLIAAVLNQSDHPHAKYLPATVHSSGELYSVCLSVCLSVCTRVIVFVLVSFNFYTIDKFSVCFLFVC